MTTIQHPLDAAVAGFDVESWVTRADERGVAIVRDGTARRLVSILGGTAAADDPARTERPPWDLAGVAVLERPRGSTLIVEGLQVGEPSTRRVAGSALAPFALDVAAAVVAAHARDRLTGPLHPALVFVTDDGRLAGISQRILRSRVAAPEEGRAALFASMYPTPGELRGEPPAPADDVFRLAALVWRWRHGRAPFGSDATELSGTLTGSPRDAPTDELDRLLVRAFAPDPEARPAAAELAAALHGGRSA
jgi:hypothetical protein